VSAFVNRTKFSGPALAERLGGATTIDPCGIDCRRLRLGDPLSARVELTVPAHGASIVRARTGRPDKRL